MNKSKKGFTLVELVIVIAVIAILTSVLLPTFAGILQRAKDSVSLQKATHIRDEFVSTNLYSINQMSGYIISVDNNLYYVNSNGNLSVITETFEDFKNSSNIDYEELFNSTNENYVIFKPLNSELESPIPTIDAGITLTTEEFLTWEECIENEYITLSENGKSITEFSYYIAEDITKIIIPYGITDISDMHFGMYCRNITEMVVPSTFSFINGDFDFDNFDKTTNNYIIENNITYLKAWDNDCLFALEVPTNYNVANIVLNENCKETLTGIFSGNTYIKTVELPQNFKVIGNGTFSSCTNLTSINIPEGVTYIGASAFYKCTSLTSVTLPSSLETLLNNAFHTTGLTSIVIPNNVKDIPIACFRSCQNLTSITLSSNLSTIGGSAFYDCKNLNSITIPSTVVEIGGSAFYNCIKLTSMTIPNSVEKIGLQTFIGCTNLTSLTLSDSLKEYYYNTFDTSLLHTYNNIYYVKTTKTNDYRFAVKPVSTSTTSVSFHSNCIAIAGNFSTSVSLSSVTLPNNLKSIGYAAFELQTKLKTITLPATLTYIGARVFKQSGITSIVIPEGVTELYSYTFSECKSLTSIVIPSSCKYLAGCDLYVCSALKTITFHAGTRFASNVMPGTSNITTVNFYGTEEEFLNCDLYSKLIAMNPTINYLTK